MIRDDVLSDSGGLRESLTKLERDARSLPLFMVGPDDARPCPALIIVHEIFGLNDHIKDVARRFARQRLRVFAPDLFAEAPGLPEDRNNLEAMRKVWAAIPDSQLIADLRAVLAFASARPDVKQDRVGTIGYCMGGAIAFMFAASSPELAFVIDYYGRIFYPETTSTKPRHPIDYAASLNCPILALFSGQDELIPMAHIDELARRLEAQGKTAEIKVYPQAPHAFFNDTRPTYNAEASQDAWRLTMDFIERVTAARV